MTIAKMLHFFIVFNNERNYAQCIHCLKVSSKEGEGEFIGFMIEYIFIIKSLSV